MRLSNASAPAPGIETARRTAASPGPASCRSPKGSRRRRRYGLGGAGGPSSPLLLQCRPGNVGASPSAPAPSDVTNAPVGGPEAASFAPRTSADTGPKRVSATANAFVLQRQQAANSRQRRYSASNMRSWDRSATPHRHRTSRHSWTTAVSDRHQGPTVPADEPVFVAESWLTGAKPMRNAASATRRSHRHSRARGQSQAVLSSTRCDIRLLKSCCPDR